MKPGQAQAFPGTRAGEYERGKRTTPLFLTGNP